MFASTKHDTRNGSTTSTSTSPAKRDRDRTSTHSEDPAETLRGEDEDIFSNVKSDHSSHSLPSSWKKHSKKLFLPSRHTTSSWKPHSYFPSKNNLTWRQRRKIKSISKTIQRKVDQRVQQAPFLLMMSETKQQNQQGQEQQRSSVVDAPPPQNLSISIPQQQQQYPPAIRRKDVTAGVLLGHGAFSEVYEVVSCPLNDNLLVAFRNTGDEKHKHKQQLKLVWKHLKPSTVLHSSKSRDSFCQAAVDLCMEAHYLSRLQHDNIITLHGIVQPLNGRPYSDGRYDGYGLILEALTDTLDQRLADWKRLLAQEEEDYYSRSSSSDNEEQVEAPLRRVDFTPAQLSLLTRYALQIASALQFMHSHRIVMLDVKPQNVGFVQQHTVKLFDFGLCRELPPEEDDLTATTRATTRKNNNNNNNNQETKNMDPSPHQHKLYHLPVAGTPTYLPGEVLCRQKYNCLADVYAWAMTCYELWTLERPYERMSTQEHLERVGRNGERPPVEPIPSYFQNLIQKAWAHNVKERWTMDQVVAELKTILKQDYFNVDTTFADPMHHRRNTSVASSLSKLSLVDVDSPIQGGEGRGRVVSLTAADFEQFFVSTREDQLAAQQSTTRGSGRLKSKSLTKLAWDNLKSLVPAQE